MNRKIIGMISSYKNIEQRDWLWKQTPHPFGIWRNIQMLTTEPEPDFLLLYQFDFPQSYQRISPQLTPWWQPWHRQKKSALLEIPSRLHKVPKDRIIYLLREPPIDEVVARNKDNYQSADNYCGYISGPDDFAPYPDYMPADWLHPNSFRELNEMPAPEKNRTCCWITSGIVRTANHRQRLAFLQRLRENHLDFDLYGRDLPDWSQGYGSVNNKWNVMSPYFYNLAIENYAGNKWYVSEKLWDALLAWCLPIYYGGNAADHLLPPGSFLRLSSLDEKGITYIREVTANLNAWYEAKDAITEARQIILHKLNLLEWLARIVEKLL